MNNRWHIFKSRLTAVAIMLMAIVRHRNNDYKDRNSTPNANDLKQLLIMSKFSTIIIMVIRTISNHQFADEVDKLLPPTTIIV